MGSWLCTVIVNDPFEGDNGYADSASCFSSVYEREARTP